MGSRFSSPEFPAQRGREVAIRRWRFPSLFALALGLALACAPSMAQFCPPGHNLADLDHDDLYDYACVGDWDGDGSCEMVDDIAAAVASLNDPGTKLVYLDTCSYSAPPALLSHEWGIIELPSHTSLIGRGSATVLNGFAGTDLTSTQAVVSNADHVDGNTDVTVRNLTIDGGWEGADSTGFPHNRMGVFYSRCDHCRAEDLTVTDTAHACLYASNSTDIDFIDSDLANCGNYTGSGTFYPCVYLYAVYFYELRDARVEGVECNGSGSSAISTRRGTPNAVLDDLVFENNVVRNTRYDPGAGPKPCFRVSGVGGAQYLNNSCINTGGFANISADGYYSAGGDLNASANIWVDGLQIINTSERPAVRIGRYAENFTLRNITVNSTAGSHCVEFETPLRNFVLEDSTLWNCGMRGVSQVNDQASGVQPDETLTFRNLHVISAGGVGEWEGVLFRGPTNGLLLDGLEVAGATSHGLSFDALVENSTLSNLDISDAAGAGVRIGGDSGNLTLEMSQISETASDCVSLLGIPGGSANHDQLRVTSSSLTDCGARGIGTAADLLFQGGLIEDVVIDGTDDDGIELLLSQGVGSDLVVEDNLIRDVGRAQDGAAYHGIQISGSLASGTIADNTVEDLDEQATYGIYHDVMAGNPSYLCTNTCLGTLWPTECLHAATDPSFESDVDGDGIVDACDDGDEDGVLDVEDNCVGQFNPFQADADEDGYGDACDNCVSVPNPGQGDFDADTEGDHCDLNDGLIYVVFGGPEVMNWQLEQGFLTWNAYTGSLKVLVLEGLYTQPPGSNAMASRHCGIFQPSLTHDLEPGPGKVAFFLVTGVAAGHEGSLGHDSDGNERPNYSPCPGGDQTILSARGTAD